MSSTENITSLRNAAAGGRASEVKGLKVLKSPAEGGSKKDHEDFLIPYQAMLQLAGRVEKTSHS